MQAGNFEGGNLYAANGWLKEQDDSLLQRNPSFGETPDQVHFGCSKLYSKVKDMMY